MNRIIAMIIFFPALIGWIIFAPSYKWANFLTEKMKINKQYNIWRWCGVVAFTDKK